MIIIYLYIISVKGLSHTCSWPALSLVPYLWPFIPAVNVKMCTTYNRMRQVWDNILMQPCDGCVRQLEVSFNNPTLSVVQCKRVRILFLSYTTCSIFCFLFIGHLVSQAALISKRFSYLPDAIQRTHRMPAETAVLLTVHGGFRRSCHVESRVCACIAFIVAFEANIGNIRRGEAVQKPTATYVPPVRLCILYP